jgi:anthranilate phosphoribosyltransferase
MTWPAVLGPLLAGRALNTEQAAWAMERIMAGEATGAQFGAFAGALRARGETVDEIAGLVEVMRRHSLKVEVEGTLVDTCGTGGDRAGTINVSTVAAFVVAGAGARVAKHGNRASSSACGSADLLEELGVKIDLGPEGVARCIEEAGMGFCFAQVFHPSMRHAAPYRKELGVGTIFNFLGPLTNPAGARHQAIGVSDPAMAPKMAEILARLGTVHALVFFGSDGLDELTTTGTSTLYELKGGTVIESVVAPESLGFKAAEPSQLKGGTAEDNAKIALEVLSGAQGPALDLVLLNAAAGIVAADLAPGLAAGVEMARTSIESGKARGALDGLIEVSNRTAPS